MPLTPGEYTVAEFRGIDLADYDAAELEAALESERAGQDRVSITQPLEAELDERGAAAEPEPAEPAPSEPELPTYPPPNADERVLLDPSGAGAGATFGHQTIHMTDDGRGPRCGANVGANARMVARSELSEDIDTCGVCPTA